MAPPNLNRLHWVALKDEKTYVVSTDRKHIDVNFVIAAFGTEDMPWAKKLSLEEAEKMLDNSLTFGLYDNVPTGPDESEYKQIGMARFITDHITFAYLTDVYILPEYRRDGLARWLMFCCREMLDEIPAIRRSMLVTNLSYGAEFYKETLGMNDIKEEEITVLTNKKHGQKN